MSFRSILNKVMSSRRFRTFKSVFPDWSSSKANVTEFVDIFYFVIVRGAVCGVGKAEKREECSGFGVCVIRFV
jgi:hypothetical protein